EYFPLSGGGSFNATWLANVYQALLGRGTANDGTAAQQLQTLNNTSPAGLQQARFTVALQILNSTEYRRRLLAGFLTTYLGKPFNPASTDVDPYLNLMNNMGYRQEGILRDILSSKDYFKLT